jgi:hypothetical protein
MCAGIDAPSKAKIVGQYQLFAIHPVLNPLDPGTFKNAKPSE